MSNGIGRLRLKGISIQSNFGTASSTVDYFIPSDEAFLITPNVNKAENNAAMGAGYEVVDVQNTIRSASFPLNFKLSEELLPVILSQKFSISTTDNGDSTYNHVLTYENVTQNWFTVFMEDDQRTDYRMRDVLFDAANITVNAADHIMIAGTGVGHYPESGDYTVTAVTPKVFTGPEASFTADDFGGTASGIPVETVTANHAFTLSGDDTNFNIGDEDITFHEIQTDRFETEFTGKLSDRTDYDIYTANTARLYNLIITGTRTIGTASTNPSITFAYPKGKPMTYTDEGDLDTNLKFNATYLALKQPDVATSPLQVTVVNEVSSY